ncbi:hypothetical protein H4R18_005079 [Coemansia javaensis]|uniref:Uncharacterized protein n=1 Tax=Coemansia javaensis TaxID=2761396 RepID=A0A9W8H755_9FUNG|nr:hypothetical protein H4R18_005079 [Coemansia javaensis]
MHYAAWCALLLVPGVLGKVRMDVYVESRCPDYDNQDAVDLHFNYIGKLNSSLTYGCFANVQQLCVQKNSDASTTLQYILCQGASPSQIGGYWLFAECLKLVPSWFSTIRCVAGSEGAQLLQNSVVNSQHNDVTASLTFALNGQKRCVFDSGHWVTAEDGCPGGGSVPLFGKSIRELAGSAS